MDFGKPLLDTLVYNNNSLPASLTSFSWNTRRIESVTEEPYPLGDIPAMINGMLANLPLIAHLHLGPALTEFTESETVQFDFSLGASLVSLSVPHYPAPSASAFAGLEPHLKSAVISLIDPRDIASALPSVQELTIVPVSGLYVANVSHWANFSTPGNVTDLSIALPLVAELDVNISESTSSSCFRLNLEQSIVNLQIIWNSPNITFRDASSNLELLDQDVTGALELDFSAWYDLEETGGFEYLNASDFFPASVTSFKIHAPANGWTLPDLFYASSVANVEIYGYPPASFGVNGSIPENLERLTFNDFPSDALLESEWWAKTVCEVLPSYPALSELRFHNVKLNWTRSLYQGCFDLPRYSALQTFELTTSSPFVGAEPLNLPVHVVDFTFAYTGSENQTCSLNLDIFLEKLSTYSPSPLRRLTITGIIDSSTNAAILNFPTAFQDLQYLDLSNNGIANELPENWFEPFTSLSHIDLSDNSFTGPIPTSFLKESIEHFNLSFNFFNAWSLTSASDSALDNVYSYAFRTVDVSNNNLTTVPTDDAFAIFTQLEILDLSNNDRSETGLQDTRALPIFWHYATSPVLRKVNLSNSRFAGNLPPTFSTAESNTLVELDVSNNLLCGGLPSTGGNDVYGERWDFSNNFLTHDLPLSWSQLHTNVKLDLTNNYITGSIVSLGKPFGWPKIADDFVPSSQQSFGGNVVSTSARKNLPRYAIDNAKKTANLQKLSISLAYNEFEQGLLPSIAYPYPTSSGSALRYNLGYLDLTYSGLNLCATNFTQEYEIPAGVTCVADSAICACQSQLSHLCDWDSLESACAQVPSNEYPNAPYNIGPRGSEILGAMCSPP